jgi:hypothetical protein
MLGVGEGEGQRNGINQFLAKNPVGVEKVPQANAFSSAG